MVSGYSFLPPEWDRLFFGILLGLGRLYLCQRRAVNGPFDLLAGNMGIDLSGGEILVSKDLLEHPDISAACLLYTSDAADDA